MKNVLLTGSEGFIGSRLLYTIPSRNINYVGYDILKGQDIRDRFKLEMAVELNNIDTIINLAARTGVKYGERYAKEYFDTNVFGLSNVIAVAEKHKCRLIHFSSSSVFKQSDKSLKEDDIKEPVSVYGITKLAGEMLIKKSACDWTIIRPFTVIGENGRKGMLIDRWKEQFRRGDPVSFYGDGTTYRGYTYIQDLIDGVLASKLGDYNLGGNQVITLNEMWEIFKSVNPKADRMQWPLPSYDVARSVADCSKARQEFGWEHKTDIREKLRQLCAVDEK